MQNTLTLSPAIDSINSAAEAVVNKDEIRTAAPSIKIDSIKASVTVSTDSVPAKQETTVVTGTPAIDYGPALSLERAAADDTDLVAHDRAHYVAAFKRGVQKTALATLEMCRVVYEANRVLDDYQFGNFCKEVGYRENSSTIRKFIAIGKVYPRFIQYADQLPSAWTAIYQITQIPADDFEAYLENGERLNELKGKRLANMLKKTTDVSDITKPLQYDGGAGGHVFAKVVATKKMDDKDWRAIEKAMNEMAARLPIKFVVPAALLMQIEQARLRRYEQSKKHYVGSQQFRPETWDMGEEANKVLPRPEPKVIAA